MPTSDADLLRLFAETHANEAFTELVERNIGLVYSAALRRLGGDSHRAADVAQLVFSALARDADRLQSRPTLAGWLYSTTRNISVNLIRAEQRRRGREKAAMDDLVPNDPLPDWEQLRPVLDDAMDQLSAREREAILLRFFAAQPFRDVGVALRISEDAARMRVDRALEKLRAVLARRGVRSSGAALGLILAHQAVAAPPAGLAHTVAAAAAAGAANAPATVSLLALMTTQKSIVAAGVCALLGISVAWHESQLVHAAEIERETHRRQLRHELTQLTATQARVSALQRELDGGLAATAAPESQPTTSANPSAANGNRGGHGRVAANTAQSDPEIAALWAHERAKAQVLYTSQWRSHHARGIPLLPKLGLSAEQLAAYHALGQFEYTTADFADFGEPGRTVEYFNERTDRQWEEKVRSVLGDERYAVFDRGIKADREVQSLSSYVSRLEVPLERRQVLELFELLSAPEARKADGTFDWVHVDSKACEVLNPAQQAAWKRQRDLVQFQRELTQAYARPRG